MTLLRTMTVGVITLALAAGCKRPETSQASTSPDTASAAGATGDTANAGKPDFDINAVPVSNVTLGDFPYIKLPEGYTNHGFGQTNKAFARFPFWVNGAERWVEGRFHGEVFGAQQGRDGSELEVKRNFDELVKQMGGVKVSEGRIPKETIDAWGGEITQGFIEGLGNVYDAPVTTYVVRRDDGNIWIHLVADNVNYAYVIGQEKGFQQTASLLPASELKKQLDASGKVALQVNFATDQTAILPESLPQLDQVVQLLKEDASLQLAINGHTDNTGNTARNQTLSEGRAKAVVDAIVAKGVDAARLAAAGFGDSQPVADNGSEAGKATNRRVELVRR